VKKQGHEVIEWNPPPHSVLNTVIMKTWSYDGGYDCISSFNLSGEPISPQLATAYDKGLVQQYNATQIAETNVRQRELKKEYLEYWNSTAEKTSTGKPVDAVICPVAPFAAARPGLYSYYGYTTWVNLLDYTSVIVPLTNVDPALDPADKDYKPLNEEDKTSYESYDPKIYEGAHVSLQIVGRRFQEEKMLAVADLATGALKALKS